MDERPRFLTVTRETTPCRPVCERISDYREVTLPRGERKDREQASRCMNCGTPFCHGACPLGNDIPEWNNLLFAGRWEEAARLLFETNNFPEFTGRLCPALCEYACVLGKNDHPVTTRENELALVEYAFRHGLVKPRRPRRRTGRTVAVIGSGPAGLACADQLNRAGHAVTVFERDRLAGGILRYGIPDFKLDKSILDRRITLMKKERISFQTGANAGSSDLPLSTLRQKFDAVCLAFGSRQPRDLPIPGRDLSGIRFAMEYLVQSNRLAAGENIPAKDHIVAKDKRVVVIGGGDTGSDCVGTAHRQGAACVVQIELLPRPPECRPDETPWPKYPLLLKTTSSHEEGGERRWAVLTREFKGNGRVERLSCVTVEFTRTQGATCPVMREVSDSGFEIEADLVILALGFLHAERTGIIEDFEIALDQQGNVRTDDQFMTSLPGVFACGDMRRGQSLVVRAVSEGRRAARAMDEFLTGKSLLPEM